MIRPDDLAPFVQESILQVQKGSRQCRSRPRLVNPLAHPRSYRWATALRLISIGVPNRLDLGMDLMSGSINDGGLMERGSEAMLEQVQLVSISSNP